jgi:dephospho-CoA kinase
MNLKTPKLFIGLVGLPGAGKTTLARILTDKFVQMGIAAYRCKLSDRMRVQTMTQGLALTRSNISEISWNMRREHGQDYWAKILLEGLEKISFNIAFIEGIWVVEELLFFKEKLGGRFILIGLDVTKDILLKRIRARLQGLDKRERQREIYRVAKIVMSFVIEKFIKLSDIIILNNTNEIKDLEQAADEFIDWYYASLYKEFIIRSSYERISKNINPLFSLRRKYSYQPYVLRF